MVLTSRGNLRAGLARALALLALLAVGYAGPAGAVDAEQFTEASLAQIKKPWKGDLDGMIKRRVIRALVTYSKTNYFLDGPRQRGITYESLKQFEKLINQQAGKGHLKVLVILIPVNRDQLLPMLIEGRGDLAAANLTRTSDRLKTVDFADPVYANAREVVVTGPGAPAIKSLEDLSGKTVRVRKSSSYYESLLKLNQRLAKAGQPPVKIQEADERLETEDILEMAGAGLVKITVADDYLANFWSRVFSDIKVRDDLVLRQGGQIAWAIRRNSPLLKQAINQHVRGIKQGTLHGNMLINKYLKNVRWANNSLGPESMDRFKGTIKYFRKYAARYDFDWLMVAALAYQESRLNQKLRSPKGAVGVMQILPSTAAGPPVEIPDIEKLDKNIHAGVKYLRHLHDHHFKDTDMDEVSKILFTFASYNAGPARVAGLRGRAEKMGLNPDLWFRNVEVAAAREIGRETVQYVSNIFKYYLAYRQIVQEMKIKSNLREGTP